MMVRRRLGRIAFYLLVAGIIFYAVFRSIGRSSVARPAAAVRSILARQYDAGGYVALLEQPFARNILNSLIVAVVATSISLFLALTAA
jgi:trehalose/maltose transport system permease protein